MLSQTGVACRKLVVNRHVGAVECNWSEVAWCYGPMSCYANIPCQMHFSRQRQMPDTRLPHIALSIEVGRGSPW